MKKLFLVFAVMGMLTLFSCSGGYDSKTAHELCEKCKDGSYSESDVNKLLEQYEACWKEFAEFRNKEDKKGELTDEERGHYHDCLYALSEMEYALCGNSSDSPARKYPETENKVREITKKYHNID